jgi:hypothetical protein
LSRLRRLGRSIGDTEPVRRPDSKNVVGVPSLTDTGTAQGDCVILDTMTQNRPFDRPPILS